MASFLNEEQISSSSSSHSVPVKRLWTTFNEWYRPLRSSQGNSRIVVPCGNQKPHVGDNSSFLATTSFGFTVNEILLLLLSIASKLSLSTFPRGWKAIKCWRISGQSAQVRTISIANHRAASKKGLPGAGEWSCVSSLMRGKQVNTSNTASTEGVRWCRSMGLCKAVAWRRFVVIRCSAKRSNRAWTYGFDLLRAEFCLRSPAELAIMDEREGKRGILSYLSRYSPSLEEMVRGRT